MTERNPIAEHRCSGQADCPCAVHVVWRAMVRREGVELTPDQTMVVGTMLRHPGKVERASGRHRQARSTDGRASPRRPAARAGRGTRAVVQPRRYAHQVARLAPGRRGVRPLQRPHGQRLPRSPGLSPVRLVLDQTITMALADLDLLVERRRDLRRVLHDLTGAIGA